MMDAMIGAFRRTGKKPSKSEIVAAHTAEVTQHRARVIRRMADRLIAGDASWAEDVQRIEIGHAVRMTNEAIALAFKEIRK